MTTNRSPRSQSSIYRGLVLAGLLLGTAAASRLLTPDYISRELADRSLGVLMGALLILYANALPKELTPLIRMRCDPAAEQAIRRFVGWSLTLGGVAYVLAWLVAPYETANVCAAAFLGATLLLVAARLALGSRRGSRA